MDNYYKVLGLKLFASIEEVEKAYKKLYDELLNDEKPLNNVLKLKYAQKAYDILSNPQNKYKYDLELKEFLKNVDEIFSNAIQEIQNLNYTKAIELLKICLDYNSEDHLLYLTLGMVYKLNGNYNEAIEIFKKGLKLNCELYNFYKNLGDVYKLLGEDFESDECYLKAVDEITSLLDIDENNYELYELLGELFTRLKCYEEAKDVYEMLVEKFPENLNIRRELATVLYELNEYEQAEKHLLEALRISPRDEFSLFYLGLLYFKQRYLNLAVQYLSQSLEINPSQKEVKLLIDSISELRKKIGKTVEEILLESEPIAVLEGVIKWYNKELGVGVISCSQYPTVLLHYSSLKDLEDKIKAGVFVRFGVVKDNCGLLAKDLEILDQQDLLERLYGIIKYLDMNSKIGIIVTNSGKNYFFNFADVNAEDLDKLELGAKVVFESKLDVGIADNIVNKAFSIRVRKN